jgi:hypothetical protein
VRGWQSRILYFGCALGIVVLGLASRRYQSYLPMILGSFAGDTLWALMVYLGLGSLAPQARVRSRAAAALAVCYLVEVSQLYHAPWIDALRHTRIGGLVLGFSFLWSDLVCYTCGVGCGAILEHVSRGVLCSWARTKSRQSSITAVSVEPPN